MTTHDFHVKKLAHLLATTDTTEISTDDVARTLIGHDALDDYDWSTPAHGAVDLTRADGEIMRCILHYDAETDEPTGWTTAEGPSTDELQSEDGGTSDDPERVIRALHAAILTWLDNCDMSDDNGQAYLVVDHENAHATSIAWNRKRKQFVCEEMPPHGSGDEYTATDADDIIARLDEQARK